MQLIVLSLVWSVATITARPQLDIPASGPTFFNFPSRSGSGVEGELNSVSVVSDDVSGTQLSVLNRRTSPSIQSDAGPPMPYSFNYNVEDEESQVYHSRQEESDGETVTGSYSYVDPTGALIIVKYRQVERAAQPGLMTISGPE